MDGRLLAALIACSAAAGCGGAGAADEPRRPNTIGPPGEDGRPRDATGTAERSAEDGRPPDARGAAGRSGEDGRRRDAAGAAGRSGGRGEDAWGRRPAGGSPGGRVVARLTPAQLAGQHVVFPFRGAEPPQGLLRRIARGEAAGVLLLGRNVVSTGQVRALARRLQAVPRPPGLRAPLLLMVDQEGGSVKRLPGAPARSAPAMAATGDPGVARREGRATAATLRRAGVNVDLAPVVDVVRAGGALAREGRGFGTSAPAAAAYGAAFASGLRAGGVAATAKHFPGFGAARVNTDQATATIGLDARTLRTVDRPPFRAAIAAGAQLVMLASARYPALDDAPAVLSDVVIGRELRAGLRFRGVAISDDLQAPALAPYGGASGAAVRAARAGIDLLLFARSYRGAARAAERVARALREGALARAELEAGAARVLALRAGLR